jgi:hypothetical protein
MVDSCILKDPMYLIVLMVYFNIFIMYLNVFIIYFSVFIMNFNVFTNTIIGNLPPSSHYNISAMCTHLHIFFSLLSQTYDLHCLLEVKLS